MRLIENSLAWPREMMGIWMFPLSSFHFASEALSSDSRFRKPQTEGQGRRGVSPAISPPLPPIPPHSAQRLCRVTADAAVPSRFLTATRFRHLLCLRRSSEATAQVIMSRMRETAGRFGLSGIEAGRTDTNGNLSKISVPNSPMRQPCALRDADRMRAVTSAANLSSTAIPFNFPVGASDAARGTVSGREARAESGLGRAFKTAFPACRWACA